MPKPEGQRAEIIKLRREKRNGRECIVCEGFPGWEKLDRLASQMKRACATGGTVKERTIEIQGDHRDALAALLLAHGYRSVRAGG